MDSIIFDLNNRIELFDSIIKEIDKCDCDNVIGGSLTTNEFSDGEVLVYFNTSVRGKRIYILTTPNTPKKREELDLAIDAAKRAGANDIIPIITYFPYSRMDKIDNLRGPIGAKVMAERLENRGATSIITFDLHADQIQGFFNIPVMHMEGKYLFDRYIFNLYRDQLGDNLVLCAPDAGAGKRVKGFRDQLKSRWELDLPMVYIDKTRGKANEVSEMTIIGEVRAKDVIIIDDMCDTAGTLCKAAEELKSAGAKSVRSIVTHGVLSGPALERIHNAIEEGHMDDFVCSDSLPISGKVMVEAGGQGYNPTYSQATDFITLITTAKQIVKAIVATERHTSVEQLKAMI